MSLRIVPYNPNDYSLSKPVVNDEEPTHETISQVLSLYFQFKEYASCFVMMSGQKHAIDISYDEDEASATQLFVTSTEKFIHCLNVEEPITVYLEIFETLFNFDLTILAVHLDDALVVTETPRTIRRLSRRKYPRVRIVDSENKHIVVVNNSSAAKMLSIGINSIEISRCENLANTGSVKIQEYDFLYEVIRSEENSAVLAISFSSSESYGQYFDIYRSFSYPSLRPRYSRGYEEALELFRATGYLDKYTDTSNETLLSKIEETFESVRKDSHKYVVDYYTVDDSGKLTGSSGLAYSQVDTKSIPYWCLQHMCAVKNSKDLENSGILYSWRAEYLSGRPEDLFMIAKFSSESKWIQRIFHKFHSIIGSYQDARLLQTVSMWVEFEPTENHNELSVNKVKIGSVERKMGASQEILIGLDPVQLNFANLLEECLVFKDFNSEKLVELIGGFMRSQAFQKRRVKVVIPAGYSLSSTLRGELSPSNGLSIIPKSALLDFSKSIKHSIAVTIRKNRHAA